MKSAKAGEDLGYGRYWVVEHHDLPGLVCTAPEVLLSDIGIMGQSSSELTL